MASKPRFLDDFTPSIASWLFMCAIASVLCGCLYSRCFAGVENRPNNFRGLFNANQLISFKELPDGKFDISFVTKNRVAKKPQDAVGIPMSHVIVAVRDDYVVVQSGAQTRFLQLASIRQVIISEDAK